MGASSPAADRTRHTLQRAGENPISNLTDGRTYYVLRVDSNKFQLASTPGGAAIDVAAAGAGGVHTIGVEGIEFDGAGATGEQRLAFDLINKGNGTDHRLLGAGGARSGAGGDVGNDLSEAKAQGAAGSPLFSGKGSLAHTEVDPNVVVSLGDNAQLRAKVDVSLTADSTVNANASSGSITGGLIAVGYSESSVISNQTVTSSVGVNALIDAGNNVSIGALSHDQGFTFAQSSGGGFM